MVETAKEELMRMALSLAEKGRGKVSPNPLVGAIIVNNGEIVGRGYHDGVGRPHAEVHALSQAGGRARGASMYVTLEPCSTWGRTPPCTDAIIKAGISSVFVATTDPNPSVSGNGIRLLRESGIEVKWGLLRHEAERQNESYMHYMRHRLPFVVLKVAATIDGKIATHAGESKWITSQESRDFVQSLRSEMDAILVGVGTVLADNPSLTVRKGLTERKPVRIILDSRLRTPSHAAVLDDRAPTVMATGDAGLRAPENAAIWPLRADSPGRLSLEELLKRAAKEKITSILVEGGAKVFSSFLFEGRVQKIVFLLAPRILGRGMDPFSSIRVNALSEALPLDIHEVSMIGSDIRVIAYPRERSESNT
jgi:diaminohydroxyphosphoribosylaminopyrimidine deaminase/5-amino-6-(5-phosphoribosylamino)uracil reductase